jgi:hypothetical protein
MCIVGVCKELAGRHTVKLSLSLSRRCNEDFNVLGIWLKLNRVLCEISVALIIGTTRGDFVLKIYKDRVNRDRQPTALTT